MHGSDSKSSEFLPQDKTPCTVIVPTKNEERNIERTLGHLEWASEIVVFDSYSDDSTVQIAEELGARVLQREFDDFASHKNWVLDNIQTDNEWILIIDADELVTPELAFEISQVISGTEQFNGYYIPRKNYFMGKWIKHGGWYPNWNLRLLKKGMGRYEDRIVHEHIDLDGEAGFLKSPLIHEDYKGIDRYFERHNVYSRFEAIEAEYSRRQTDTKGPMAGSPLARGPMSRRYLKTLAYRHLPGRSVFKFFWTYFFRLGFLDGRAGFRYCLLHSLYEYQISLKMEELRIDGSPMNQMYSSAVSYREEDHDES